MQITLDSHDLHFANHANHMIRNDSHDSQIRLYANHMIRKNANHNANHTFLENNIIPNFFNLSIFLHIGKIKYRKLIIF